MEKLLKTQQDREQFLTWIDWLRADVLPQGVGLLEGLSGFCCLGVGCVLFVPEDKLTVFWNNSYILGGLPSKQKQAPEWLKNINSHYDCLPMTRKNYNRDIVHLNDGLELTFPQIAEELLFAYKDELEQ